MLRLELEDGTAERTLIAVIKSRLRFLGVVFASGFSVGKNLFILAIARRNLS